MVKIATTLAALLPFAAAWPTAIEVDEIIKRAGTTGRKNTGAGHPVVTFSESQLVDVTSGSGREFEAPGSTDLRGQCPGLNAAANHGFLPRNGKATIAQTVSGLGAAYNLGADAAAALAAISILLSGDIPSGTWSIGGSFPATLPGLGTPYGLLGTHNEYEGDASVARGDAYLNGGSVDVFQISRFTHLYNLVGSNLNLDNAASHSNYVTQLSIDQNPYYFSGPFSSIVAIAAHNFVVNFFSNHSAAVPTGTLTGDVLKSFFAVTGSPGSFVHNQYQERIPYNWYKRPGGTAAYSAADVGLDVVADAAIYPNILRFGGNTGKVDTFTGFSLSDLTGGVYTSSNLLQGNNLACFFFQASEAFGVAELTPAVTKILGSTLAPILAPIKSVWSELTCPQLGNFDFSVLNTYPGYKADTHFP